jgi:hypothetical protein
VGRNIALWVEKRTEHGHFEDDLRGDFQNSVQGIQEKKAITLQVNLGDMALCKAVAILNWEETNLEKTYGVSCSP